MENTVLYYIASSLPFWAIPLSLILIEVGQRNRMRHDFVKAYVSFFVSLCLLVLTGLFLYFGGYKDTQALLRMFE